MKRSMLLALLLPLAGCAGTAEKAAEAGSAPVPASQATLSSPVAEVPAPAVAAPVQPREALPLAEPTGWEMLSRRLLAWGDPMRRSVEQYCPPENTIRNP